ncbi:HTTM domain-containing protein [Kocuria sp. CNJ-770]|uniref:HTTM domain-containing protein n=1 Tax=Kocuria sp. CNJ-770 TaxID=1904964 RepID=UPI0013018825|nr:HTTM domain-containing protein [Kocuria sp. CNJ-770]
MKPEPIAMVRICLGIVTAINSLEIHGLLTKIASGKIRLPVHGILPAPTQPFIDAYLVIALVSAFAVVVGWCTVPAASILTVLNVGVLFWDQQTYSSHRLLMTLLMAFLIFAQSDAAWSLSRRHGEVPWWPQLLMMTQLSVCYFFAAVSKISVVFLSGVPLSIWVWAPLPWWVFTLLAVATVAVELYLAVGLWVRSTRVKAAVLGFALHLGIVVLMREETVPLIAFAVTCLGLYWLFLSRPTIGTAPLAAVRASGLGAISPQASDS